MSTKADKDVVYYAERGAISASSPGKLSAKTLLESILGKLSRQILLGNSLGNRSWKTILKSSPG